MSHFNLVLIGTVKNRSNCSLSDYCSATVEMLQQTMPQLLFCCAAVGKQSCTVFYCGYSCAAPHDVLMMSQFYCGCRSRRAMALFSSTAVPQQKRAAVDERRSRRAELCTVFYCSLFTKAAARCRTSCRTSQNFATIGALLYHPVLVD